MKIKMVPILGLAIASTSLLGFAPQNARAATGTVIIVAEGLSPQVLDLGKGYLRKADEDAELTTSFDELKDKAKPATVGADALAQIKGLLQAAHDNGYATGLITTGDVTKVAPLFYNLQGDVAADLTAKDAPYEFIAGGGAANLAGASEKIAANGGTFVASSDALDGDLKGRILATEVPGELNYSLDRDPAQESGLGELATAALDTLTAGNKPFVLVIHDSLIAKAVQNRDTPALFEQFRELNTIVGDAVARRDDDPNLKVAALMTGATMSPTFTTQSPEEQNNAYYVASNLDESFTFAGQSLKGKTVEDITAFADVDAGEYKGWKVSEADKAKIAAGTLDPEIALRASYEPTLKLNYVATPSDAYAFTLGFEAPEGLVPALKAAVATPAK
ncbi:hypothetical protein IAD21_04841 [Abditibacteriota bacterium]|nr:hypothetical protein IAD21_04841 [Abditibacteriota bacterium]